MASCVLARPLTLSPLRRCRVLYVRILLGLADGGKSNKLELIEASTAGFVELKKKSQNRTYMQRKQNTTD